MLAEISVSPASMTAAVPSTVPSTVTSHMTSNVTAPVTSDVTAAAMAKRDSVGGAAMRRAGTPDPVADRVSGTADTRDSVSIANAVTERTRGEPDRKAVRIMSQTGPGVKDVSPPVWREMVNGKSEVQVVVERQADVTAIRIVSVAS